MKRDDLYEFAGVRGGKVRTCLALAEMAQESGKHTLVTAGARSSPQAVIVARVAQAFGMKARVHMPTGSWTDEMHGAQQAGAEIVQHKAGYNSVIVARAREDAAGHSGCFEIPFGMQCRQAVVMTATQVDNIPEDVKRIVVAVGSGMSVAGILYGLACQRRNIPVLGVVVGADPIKRLVSFAPFGWRQCLILVPAGLPYSSHGPDTGLGGVVLDPIYEAKCLRFLEPDDLFWVVGIRPSLEVE